MLGLTRALWRHGHTVRARELTLEAIAILEREPGPDLVFAYERAAASDAIGGRSHDAVMWAEKGIALAEQLGIENVVRRSSDARRARASTSATAAGLEDLREGLALSLRLGLGIETAVVVPAISASWSPSSRASPRGVSWSEASLEFSRRRGLTHNDMWTRAARLVYLLRARRVGRAPPRVRRDRAAGIASTAARRSRVIALTARRSGARAAGKAREAARDVASLLPRAREIGDPQVSRPCVCPGCARGGC